jgi:photosystem II stability/assembly factor-like uncharacterized protein
MSKHIILFQLVMVLNLLAISLFSQTPAKVDANTFGELKARHLGSATMSGRITAIDAVFDNPDIIYVGAASGGIWKTENGGIKFKPVFEEHIQSIGALRIDQSKPEIVWAGTGESNTRNSVSVGNGIYKTTNGGDTWLNMGLENTERISSIIIHPENSDIVFAGALGHLWNPNPERGVYKTTDGGKTWQNVLFVDENTGCADITINPENPEILYCAMWDFRRLPYTFRSGGKGSGLYRSTDGGNTWQKLIKDLPENETGRISVAVSPVNPSMVYALIEAREKGGLYRSDDNGDSWKLSNSSKAMTERPFYFSCIIPDPVDTNKVYKPGFNLNVSDDRGEKFRVPYVGGGNVHVDHHALWIGKNDNKLLYLGTDGGVYTSTDQGKTWRMFRNLPVSQFYHVSTDMETPYNVYGGLQDNGSWVAPSSSPGGVTNNKWENVGYGDGFYVFADNSDPDILYWQWQGGNYVKYYKKTNESKQIRPFGDEKTGKLRFNWNSSIAFSHTNTAMYVGSQYLHRSYNKGDTWEIISPDLTTNDPVKLKQEESGGITIDNSTAENYCTIYAIGESPLDPDVIWAGTDDGNLQLTTNGGKTWTNMVENIPGLPANTWCSSVYPGKFSKSTVYATFDGHRSGDMTPYLFKSEDSGKSWVNLIDTNVKGFCHKIIEDLVNPDLLFLGTEFGLFISIDGGKLWSRFEGDVPKVPVHDMVIHPRENDLVIATHGRGILIIDDITPIRHLTSEGLEKELFFLHSRPYKISSMGNVQDFRGDDEFAGRNPADAVYITYHLGKRHVFGDMYIEIYNKEGEFLKKLPAGTRKGINRVLWTPREKAPKVPPAPNLAFGAIYGPNYMPGDYKVRIVKGNETFEGEVSLIFDPNLPHSDSDRQIQMETLMKSFRMLEDLAFLDASIRRGNCKSEGLRKRCKRY